MEFSTHYLRSTPCGRLFLFLTITHKNERCKHNKLLTLPCRKKARDWHELLTLLRRKKAHDRNIHFLCQSKVWDDTKNTHCRTKKTMIHWSHGAIVLQGGLTFIPKRMGVVRMKNKFSFNDLMQFGLFLLALLTFIYLISH